MKVESTILSISLSDVLDSTIVVGFKGSSTTTTKTHNDGTGSHHHPEQHKHWKNYFGCGVTGLIKEKNDNY